MSSSANWCVTSGGRSTRRFATIAISRRIRSLPPGTERRDDLLIAEAGVERLVRRDELARVHAEARQRPARPDRPQRVLERLLPPERFDRDVDAAAVGQPLDLRDGIAVLRCSSVTLAPKRRATSSRPAFESTPMMSDAPFSFAPSVAHRPIGPCAKTATASPTLMLPLSAPRQPGREDVGAAARPLRRSGPSGIGARLARASGTSRYSAQAPLMVLPKRQPPSAPAALRVRRRSGSRSTGRTA